MFIFCVLNLFSVNNSISGKSNKKDKKVENILFFTILLFVFLLKNCLIFVQIPYEKSYFLKTVYCTLKNQLVLPYFESLLVLKEKKNLSDPTLL